MAATKRYFGCDGEGKKSAVESLMCLGIREGEEEGRRWWRWEADGVGYDDVSEL